MFDPTHSGYVDISMFKQILKTKHVSASDVNEMIEGMMLIVCRYVQLFDSNSQNCIDVSFGRVQTDEQREKR